MTPFEGVVIGFLLIVVARGYGNGHDIRDDWTNGERTLLALQTLAGIGLITIYAAVWVMR